MPDTSAGSIAAAVAAAVAPVVPSLPAGSLPQPSATPDARRASTADKGMPYYEKIRKDLREMLQRKKILDRNLVRILPLPSSPCPPTSESIITTQQHNTQHDTYGF